MVWCARREESEGRSCVFSFSLTTAEPAPVPVWDPELGVIQPHGWIPNHNRQAELRKIERQAATGELQTRLTDRQEKHVQHLQVLAHQEPYAFDRLSSSPANTPYSSKSPAYSASPHSQPMRGMSLQSYVPPGSSPRRTSMKTIWTALKPSAPMTPDKPPPGMSQGLIPVATLSTPSRKEGRDESGREDRERPPIIWNGMRNPEVLAIRQKLLDRSAGAIGQSLVGDSISAALSHLSGQLSTFYSVGKEALERSDLSPSGDMSPEVASAVINSTAGEASGAIRTSKRQKRK